MPELIVTLKGRELQRVPIRKTLMVIGRDDGNDIVIDNRGISRQHAMVRFEGGGFTVVDAGSSNGVFVNGLSTQAQRLNDGDEIGIGKFVIRFDASAGPSLDELSEDGDGSGPVKVTRQVDPTLALTPEEIQRLQASRKLPMPQGGYGAPPSSPARPDVRMHARVSRGDEAEGGSGAAVLVAVAIVVAAGVAWFMLRS